VFGSTPKSGQAKLRVRIEKGFFEDTLLWVEELTGEGIVESGLPFLNEGHFEASIVSSVCVYRDWSPDIQIVMVLCLSESLIGGLKVLS